MRTLGSRYVLHELLGQGTTGEVWRATRRDDGADVAVKMLRPEFADDRVVVDRFLREWQILYDINSPELVRVLDLVNERDALAIVMELVDGTDLREYLRHSAPLPVEQAVQIITHVLRALDTVHGAGVVHRDVKPENVLLDERQGNGPAVRLTDFGIARMVDTLSRGRAQLTGPIGTPLYMAPELGTGAQPTPAVDIYSAGIVLYEMLAGAPPFDEVSPTDMLRAHLEEAPLPIKGVPRPVWDVLASMLEKTPARRPPSAAEAARALESALARSGDLRPRAPRDEDTWERASAKPRVDDGAPTGDTVGGGRPLAGVGAAAGVGAISTTKAAHAGPGGGYGPGGGHGPGGYDDWDDEAATGMVPIPGSSGPQGGHWDDAATRLGPTAGGPSGPRGGWDDDATRLGPTAGGPRGWDDEDDYDDPPTDGGPVRVPSRSGAVQANRNTIISAIPANRQPAPSSGGRPPVRDNRQRLRIAAGAGLVVALIAAAGGWALASSGGSSPSSSGSDTTLTSGAAGVRTTPTLYTDNSGNLVDPTATAAYTTMISGKPVTVKPGPTQTKGQSPSSGSSTGNAPPATTTPATPSTATVPNVVGEDQNAAAQDFANAGFTSTPSWTAKCTDPSVSVGQVLSQSPAGGSTQDKASAISGTTAGECPTVPNVVGMSPPAAKSTLEGRGFSVWLNGSWSCDYGYDPVTSQSPTGGRALKGSSVSINYTCEPSPPPPSPTAPSS
ncbi:protein kinase [Frankia sp. AgB1.9]|uniref:serine/threonine-protein kinase n=1 Tax=unclassified Frankia TaxID=2632575 RepID=UPI001931FB04|nr:MULTISPECIES: serine/threonine-protein kinase [unclassified Frankia]MBL7493389.1 protein kinase [Frankia sp. AgW1.1]MBL7546919.1 protein kinase [Frankia sp. AgB1.9]MBL7621950.1 protein kinase [Frankia sp. AgB1.8]